MTNKEVIKTVLNLHYKFICPRALEERVDRPPSVVALSGRRLLNIEPNFGILPLGSLSVTLPFGVAVVNWFKSQLLFVLSVKSCVEKMISDLRRNVFQFKYDEILINLKLHRKFLRVKPVYSK